LNLKETKKSRRQDGILAALERNPTIRVKTIADDLCVSTETVRRDLAELDSSGRIQRTYGGAVKTNLFEPALSERLKVKVKQRERIAKHAVLLLGDVDCIFIGGGATTLHFARALQSINRRITVLTASFSVAIELSTNPLIEVMSLPGIVEPTERLVYGPDTLKFISQYRPRIAVMGASAIDADGVSEALLNAAQVYQAMIDNSEKVIFIADSDKFGQRALQIVAEWGPNKTLVTDQVPENELQTAIEKSGCDIQIVTSKFGS
jgi:DeoR/GlpR family transcriptional regulator of sugar metabolism